ncbi:hypothetical protein [Marinobacter salsuginis]|jgi:hypothetical protein|uniref:Transmembrane anchor protein n=1 Tax=Marinobacter salsuginis TaxID=418719 RepID=A0A5M3PZ67_9GAMM|nr:hypothetical protein [Marinobacter salsuginis]GBO88112.1 hypothetical protein MSSD14B_17800 [Marinobacter salsuginis]
MDHSVNLSTLIKASVAATIVAVIALLTLILPAEYNIDPTGIGQRLGLTVLAQSAEASPVDPESVPESTESQQVLEITVPANKGIEYKLQMEQYDKVTYEWMTDGSSLYFDLHGEPEGDTTGYFESYAIATLDTMKGSFTAPFNGSHGWYWKNTSNNPVAIQLILNGQFQIIGIKP